MGTASVIPDELRDATMFLVWGPPSHGPRTRVFSDKLGIRSEFVFSTRKRGWLVAPWKYGYQAFATTRLLRRARPELVFVQSPPSLAVLAVWLYHKLTGARYIVDAHSGAFLSPYWSRPIWLQRILARAAVTTIVTNRTFADRLERWGATATILRDIPTSFMTGEPLPRDARFTVLVVSTFAPDEPIESILEAARALPDVSFLVTGDPSRATPDLVGRAPQNVQFSGYLPDDVYYGTMQSSDAVLCLTTRDDTMQRGACEALSMARPIVTSNWPLLQEYFSKGTVHVASSPAAIVAGIESARLDHERLCLEIRDLQRDQEIEWTTASRQLADLIDQAVGGRP